MVAKVVFMADPHINWPSEHREGFRKFFECWLSEQSRDLEALVSASKDYDGQRQNGRRNSHLNGSTGNSGDLHNSDEADHERQESIFGPLLRRVLHRYEDYYRVKSSYVSHDVLSMMHPSWRSSLEDAFMWIGGWRPSLAFHLLYSKSGLQLEARLSELINGLDAGNDLGGLTSGQLGRVDELQRATLREERKLSEKLAKFQETAADSPMVLLSNIASELMREEGTSEERVREEQGRVDSALASKEESLVEILKKADNLRLRTLKDVIDILRPIQAVHFLIAAAELHLRFHDWGKKKDAREHPN